MMFHFFKYILSNFCVPTFFKEYYEKHSGEAVGRGQTAPMRHPKASQYYSLGGLTAVNVGKHSNFSLNFIFRTRRTWRRYCRGYISPSAMPRDCFWICTTESRTSIYSITSTNSATSSTEGISERSSSTRSSWPPSATTSISSQEYTDWQRVDNHLFNNCLPMVKPRWRCSRIPETCLLNRVTNGVAARKSQTSV